MEVKEENTAPKPEAASVTETQQTVTPKTKPKDPKALVGQDMTKWLLAIAVSIILLGIAYQLVGTEEPDFVITPPQKSREENATVERFEFDVKANTDLGDGFFNYSYTLVDGDDEEVTQGSITINNQSKDEKLDFDIDVEFPGERPRELVFKIQLSYGDLEQNPEYHYKKEINKDRYYKVVTTE